jgi:5-methylcytosine-specific restriction endonuclease McrA
LRKQFHFACICSSSFSAIKSLLHSSFQDASYFSKQELTGIVWFIGRQQQQLKTTITSKTVPRWMATYAFNHHGDVEKTTALRWIFALPFIQSLLRSVGEQQPESFQYAVDKYENVICRENTARYSAIKGETDHIIPYKVQNETRLENLQPLQVTANRRKGSKLEDELPYDRLACGVRPVVIIKFLLSIAMLDSRELRCTYWQLLKGQDVPKEWREMGGGAYVEHLISQMQAEIKQQQQQQQVDHSWITSSSSLLAESASASAAAGDMRSLLQVMPFFSNSSGSFSEDEVDAVAPVAVAPVAAAAA